MARNSLALADRVYVMRNGRIEFECDTANPEHRARLEDAYFGTGITN